MKVPFHKTYITNDEINRVMQTMKNGWTTMGPTTIEFENRFKEYIGCKHAISVNSATAALHLALEVVGIKEGDEVIIPCTTFTATALAVQYVNAKPVMVDVEKNTHLIDVNKIEEKITKKTKAIIPVHFSGQPCNMDEIKKISKKHKLFIIEDAAHSIPSSYKNQKIGTIGDLTCFSFYATKTLATGEGGMITTNNDKWISKLKSMRRHGINNDQWKRYSSKNLWEYDVVCKGFKYNTTDLNAAIGIEQLKKVEWMRDKREKIKKQYDKSFKNCPELILYEIYDDRSSSHHLYPLKLNLFKLKINRNEFIHELTKFGIGTSVHFIPLYRFSFYKKLGYRLKDYKNSEWIFKRLISLPIFPSMTKKQVSYVIEKILHIIKQNRK